MNTFHCVYVFHKGGQEFELRGCFSKEEDAAELKAALGGDRSPESERDYSIVAVAQQTLTVLKDTLLRERLGVLRDVLQMILPQEADASAKVLPPTDLFASLSVSVNAMRPFEPQLARDGQPWN